MSNYIKFSTGEQLEYQSVKVMNETLAGYIRSVATITTTSAAYDDVAALFKDGAVWSIVENGIEYTEWNSYTKAGAITDNRDGSVVVKMGKANTAEQDAWDAQKKAEEKAGKVSAYLVTLAGKLISEGEDIGVFRKQFETAADTLADENASIAPSLFKAWTTNEAVKAGWRRYYAIDGNAYKCLQDHTTSVQLRPDVAKEYWNKL